MQQTSANPAAEPQIRVVIIRADGSTPRELGAAMQVRRDGSSFGSIGGGALEHAAIGHAMALLATAPHAWHRERRAYPLGPNLGQCCGGHVELLFEVQPPEFPAVPGGHRLTPLASGQAPIRLAATTELSGLPEPLTEAMRAIRSSTPQSAAQVVAGWLIEPAPTAYPLFLYGAGHVGRALVAVLDGLPFAVHWIDTGTERFPTAIRPGVTTIPATDPARIASHAPAPALHLVMTYSHALDLAICHALLARNTFVWLGLIGSASKRARFAARLAEAGISDDRLARLKCPIGIPGIRSKAPTAIAIAVAAELTIWSEAQMGSGAGPFSAAALDAMRSADVS